MNTFLVNANVRINALVDHMFPKFVTANMVTMFRLFLTPILVYLLYFLESDIYFLGHFISRRSLILGLFLTGMISDFVDGRLARIRQQETQWGKMLDATADKFFFLVFVFLLYGLSKFLFAIILTLQVITVVISFFAYYEKKCLSVNMFGRVFTAMILFGFFFILLDTPSPFTQPLFYVAIPLSAVNIGILSIHSAK